MSRNGRSRSTTGASNGKSKQSAEYDRNVFLNHPFDRDYRALADALLFVTIDCGFIARSAREIPRAIRSRLQRIYKIIDDCRLGIHDISRVGLYGKKNEKRLPRFNMPFELGLFLAADHFGVGCREDKACLVFEREDKDHEAALSNIKEIDDIIAHGNDPEKVIKAVRKWLADKGDKVVPGGNLVWRKFREFTDSLTQFSKEMGENWDDMTFREQSYAVKKWLEERGRRPST